MKAKKNPIKKIVGLDFETYYDADYTLRKMSTTGYVRDSRFKVQCVGIRSSTWTKTRWYKGEEAIRKALNQFNWDECALLCHHTHFDGLILSHHYDIKPAYNYCTLSMARPLHGGEIRNDLDSLAKYYGKGNKLPNVLAQTRGVRDLPKPLMQALGIYCVNDVDIMWEIFEIMRKQYPQDELDLINLTVQAYTDPVIIVDKKVAKAEHKKEAAKREATVAAAGHTATELRSRKIFPELLREAGVEPPMKISPSTGKPTYAFAKTDIEFQMLKHHESERVRTLVEARSIVSSSIGETRARRVLEHADPALPIYLNYGKAHTFRWTGGDKMNPQNFERGSPLRNALTAPKGHKFVIVDSSQIEARVCAWLAGETQIVEDFRNGIDLYSLFAAQNIYHKPVEDITDIERFVGKVCILGLGYQMGAAKFRYTLNVGAMGPPVFLEEDTMYEQTVFSYRNKFTAIKNQWTEMQKILEMMQRNVEGEYGPISFGKGYIGLPNGMFLRYPNMRSIYNKETGYRETIYNEKSKIYGGLLTENIVQALARIVVAEQILQVADKYKVVLMVHDEVILCVPTRQAKTAYAETLKAFQTPPSWAPDLPVDGEGGITNFYQKM